MTDFGFLPATSVGAGFAGLIVAWLMYLYVKKQPQGNQSAEAAGR